MGRAVETWMRALVVVSVLAVAGSAAADGDPAPSLYQVGTNYVRIAEFEKGADALERFASLSPTAPEAPQALSDAIVLRMGLGDEPRVVEDGARFKKAYGASQPELTAKVDFALAAHAADRADLPAAERELTASMSAIDRGPQYLRMMAHALFGKALAAHADPRAAAQYAVVVDLAGSLKPMSVEIADLRAYAKGLNAFGEAIVFQADAKRAATAWPRLPRYAGGQTDKDVDAWIARTVNPWIVARSSAIDAVEPEYRKVLMIGMPPPNAVVDAASRVAMMWADATDELGKSAPTLVRKALRDKLVAAGAPLRAKAKPAAVACVSYSVKYQWTDAASTACSSWLSANYRAEFPPVDELLLPHPFRSSSAAIISPLADPKP